MYCPRLDHFVRFNFDSTISRCGHMTNPPQFETLQQMDSSTWLADVRDSMRQDAWPDECVRCKEVEHIGNKSVRQQSGLAIGSRKRLVPMTCLGADVSRESLTPPS